MKRVKKGLMAAAAVATIGVAGVATTAGVYAASDDGDNPRAALVQKIADRFNLSQEEVQQVFDEQRAERQAEHEAKQAERLQKLVDDGAITAEQKTAIEAKLAELKEERETNRDSFKDLGREERKAKKDEKKAELEQWANENGIDLSKLKGVFGGGHHGHGHGPKGDDTQE